MSSTDQLPWAEAEAMCLNMALAPLSRASVCKGGLHRNAGRNEETGPFARPSIASCWWGILNLFRPRNVDQAAWKRLLMVLVVRLKARPRQ